MPAEAQRLPTRAACGAPVMLLLSFYCCVKVVMTVNPLRVLLAGVRTRT